MVSTEDFDYNLPEELIAERPMIDRAASRLLVIDLESGALEYQVFYDIID